MSNENFNTAAIPDELAERDQWICWDAATRNGKETKIPKAADGSGNAKTNDMATWGSFETACETADERGWGIGYVFADVDPYLGIDLDGCVQHDGDRPLPKDWLPSLDVFGDCYSEFSPSGDGLHVILKDVAIPDWWTNQKEESDDGERGIEVYDTGRYFTFTGDALNDSPVATVDGLDGWLLDGWDVFNDEVPPGLATDDSDTGDGDLDVDLTVYDIISSGSHPEGERSEHPFHGSETGANFLVDDDGETFRCWRHGVTGNAHHLLGIEQGIIDCGDWAGTGLDSDTWRDIYDAAREAGYDIPAPQHATDGGTTTASTDSPDGPSLDGSRSWDWVRELHQADEDGEARFEASEVLMANHSWRNLIENDVLYWYDPERGIYQNTGDKKVRSLTRAGLGAGFSRHDAAEIAAHIRAVETVSKDEMGGPAGKVAVENGVLDLDVEELAEADPSYNFLNSLNTSFDPDADCPQFKQFLKDVVTKESDRKKLQEFAGYSLMHWGLPDHKSLFIVGPQASGKSTFLDTIRALHGQETVASLSPQQMTERFGGAELHGKWVNIRNDIPANTVKNVGTFKEIIAGDPIKAEEKGKDPFMFEPTAKHMFAANQLPDADTDDPAFYRRILLVAFPNTVPRDERDKRLDDKLQDELPGILNWALEGLERQRRHGFTGDLAPGRTADKWDKWGHTADRFASTCLEIGSVDGEPIPKKKLYRVYQQFCEDENMPCDMQQAMTRRLKTEHGADDGHATVNGKQERCFLNVQFTGRADVYRDDRDDNDGAQAGL